MGVLDIIHGYDDILQFLSAQPLLSDDLLALNRACICWNTMYEMFVGESGTLYRFLQFASWKLGLNKRFMLAGSLKERNIGRDPSIVHLTQRELLALPGEPTTQWASAAVLLGDRVRLADAPFKLRVTYAAVEHWEVQRNEGLTWKPETDRTITTQAEVFVRLLRGEVTDFIAEQAEDYCFARMFSYLTRETGAKRWPSLAGHESNRLDEMEVVITSIRRGEMITSRDHRVVQAAVMWGLVNGVSVNICYPEVVNKSWPEFWRFVAMHTKS